MADYEPFPIADFTKGMELDREAWISNAEAWREIYNGFVFRGRIVKRRGYSTHGLLYTKSMRGVAVTDGELKVNIVDRVLGAIGYSDIPGTVPVVPPAGEAVRVALQTIRPFSIHFEDEGGQVVIDDGVGGLTQAGTPVGIVNYSNGFFDFTFTGAITGSCYVTYEFHRDFLGASQNPVMGIYNLTTNTGSGQLLVWDRRRMFKWDETGQYYDDVTELDTWNGSIDDFFWADSMSGTLVICNGVDPLYAWDGANLAKIPSDWAIPTQDEIIGVPMVFFSHRRLVALAPDVSGVIHPRGAIWTKVNPDFLTNADWEGGINLADATSEGWIRSADLLGEDIFVFFDRGAQMLRFSDDFRAPFRWVPISDEYGGTSRMATVSAKGEVLTVGPTAIVGTDGHRVIPIDMKVPDLQLNWNLLKKNRSFGLKYDAAKQVIWSYVKSGDEFPSECLSYQYDDSAWAIFAWSFFTFGFYSVQATPPWDSYPDPWDSYFFAWDDATIRAGYPLLLGGDAASKVHKLFSNFTDAGAPIVFRIKSQRLNPYRTRMARLGKFEIVARRSDGSTLTVKFFRDFETTPYLTKTVSLAGDGSTEQVKVSVFVNRLAHWHQVEISHSSAGDVQIDAVIPWFQEDGEMRTEVR